MNRSLTGERFGIPSNFRFDESGLATLESAERTARRFNHNYIGNEHLLAGLATLPESDRAVGVLSSLGLGLPGITIAIAEIMGWGTEPIQEAITLTPRARSVIDSAEIQRARLAMGIGSMHLLDGLLRNEGGTSTEILELMGVSLDRARQVALNYPLHSGAQAPIIYLRPGKPPRSR